MTHRINVGRAFRPGGKGGAEAPPYTGIVLVLLLLSSLSLAAQQVRDTRIAPAVAPIGTGVLGGVVTSDDGSRPVRFAYVVLIGTGTGTVKVSSTDADGRFMFANLPADRYTVGASKPPYLGTVAGARRPGRPGTPIALADGQKISNLAIRMPLGAAITGVITDEKGQPATGVMVGLAKWGMQAGERTLVPASGSMTGTDERGRYRIFGLTPGEYVVSALRPGLPQAARSLTTTEVDAALKGGVVSASSPQPSNIRYAPVYFPGTTRATDAMPISLGIGEERQNADFKLDLVQTARVEGMVATADGQPVTAGSVILATAGVNLLRTATSTRITPDGRFAFPNAMPGTFMVLSQGSGPTAGQYAQAIIEVNGADVFGVQLTMRSMLSFSGTLVFRGAVAAPALAGRRIPLRAVAPGVSGRSGPAITPTTQNGAFNVTNVFPGRYVIGGPLAFGPTTDSVTWALESVDG